MKLIKIFSLYLLAAAVTFMSGCKKYLDEYNPSSRTDETYYNTKAGFEDLVKGNYAFLRGIVNNGSLYFAGTDILSSYGINDNFGLNLYNNNLNSSGGEFNGFWSQLYSAINIANTTLYWATQVKDVEASLLTTRIGEAKTLRAYYYFLLVETFGDVPLQLERTTQPNRSFVRTAEKDIYTQIIKDLNEAVPALPATTTEFGRATKGMAQQLLAKVYLTRGYKSYGGGQSDFQQAAAQAEAVIAGPYAMRPKYADLFDASIANFQVNNEIIFSVQYSTNAPTNGGGNNLHQYFLWDPQITPVLGRSALYGKPNYNAAPTPYYFTLFDKLRDGRYLANFHNVIFAQVAGTTGGKTFAVGDTLVYYPDVALSAADIASRRYFVSNPDQYRTNPFAANVRSHPQLKKFREPTLPYQDGGGFRDTYVFRLAETYLIAAEAYLQANNLVKALENYNKVRVRAAKTGSNPVTGVPFTTEIVATTLTLDDILDERARELLGEEFRWFELKRTGKLITRVKLYNDEARITNTISTIHLLRPIPQAQIDLNLTPLGQNPGY